MRKKGFVMPIVCMAAGAVGFMLRKKELATVFDSYTGLAEKGATVTVLLGILSAIIATACIVYAVIGCRNGKADAPYEVIMSPRSPIALLLLFFSGAIMVIGGAWYFFAALAEYAGGIYKVAFAALAAASGVSQIILASASYSKKRCEGMSLAAVVTPLYLCMWLVATYRSFGTEPALLRFCGMCITLMAATLSFYYAGGFAFGRMKLKRAIAVSLLAIYMLTVSMADFTQFHTRLIIAGLIIILSINTASLIRNSHKKRRAV